MEHNGVPIDVEILPLLADEAAWNAVRDAMIPAVDAQYRVYVRNAAGDWAFNLERFAAYCEREGIDWPRLESGQLNMRRKTFEDMAKGRPQLEALRQLRHTRDKLRKIKLAVGPRRPQPALCCGPLKPRRRAPNRKPRSGFSRRRCGCGF